MIWPIFPSLVLSIFFRFWKIQQHLSINTVNNRWVFSEISEYILLLLLIGKIPTVFQIGIGDNPPTITHSGSSKLRCPGLWNICWRAGMMHPCRNTQHPPCKSTQRKKGMLTVSKLKLRWMKAHTKRHIHLQQPADLQITSRNYAAFSILSLKSPYIHTENVPRSFYNSVSVDDV